MASRNCIGILYSYNSNWIGGSYYIQNLIQALKTLPDGERPHLKIICRKRDDFQSIKELSYPYVDVFSLHYSFIGRIFNRVTEILFGKGLVDHFYLKNIRAIFPASLLINFPPYFRRKIDRQRIPRTIYWIPDFQERYYPEFFDKETIDRRDSLYKSIAASKSSLVLSSYAALNDFEKFYPGAICSVDVLHFAVTHPPLPMENYETIQAKYKLPASFLFVPNQFWKHKNHMLICKALKKLNKAGKRINVVFSGKESDPRNPDYVPSVKNFIAEEGLESQTWFLGFIPREDQLIIMKNSNAVIQPSLFEGWSTVVEDAKALQVFLIVSDIDTHREQLKTNCSFFDPKDEDQLVARILELGENPLQQSNAYHVNVTNFAKKFLEVANK